MNPENIIATFHQMLYDSKVWLDQTLWLGVPVYKCPFDLWTYQEIISRLRPDLIVELGTAQGGSALFFASICDLVGKGEIITVDVEPPVNKPRHPRITYLTGSSLSASIIHTIFNSARGKGIVMAVLDSLHFKDHVLAEMQVYCQLVTVGSYMVVEDTNINGHPVLPEFGPQFGPGPHEAVCEFLAGRQDFVIDKSCEKFLVTFFPNGFLKKVR